jgi:hypothetical protein
MKKGSKMVDRTYKALRLSRTSMARAGQTGQHSSQALHLVASKTTPSPAA